MANWQGAARSNYVRVTDVDALRAEMEPWDISVQEGSGKEAGKFCLLCETGDGGWPSSREVDDDEGDIGNDGFVEFDFGEHVMPLVAEGEVLIVMEAGAEKPRYITSWSGAFVRTGDDVKAIYVNIDRIYEMVRNEFGVNFGEFTYVEY